MADGVPSSPLTDQLLGPMVPLAAEHLTSFLRAADRIPQTLADLAVPRPGGGPLRLTDHDVRTALAPVDRAPVPSPFAWSARTTCRALGLAAVRALVSDEARTPVDGVRLALARSLGSVRDGDRPASPMDRWLAGLSAAGRAAVQADAVTSATRLWGALDWAAFGEPPVIGRDHWWDSPHSALLAIRSRAEVRSIATDPAGSPSSVHLVVLSGPRRPTIRSELSVVALVETLRAPQSLPPGRVVGWWPDSGHVVRVDVDRAALEAGVAAIGRTVARAVAPAPFEGVARAAA
jgi:hypothetical protein